MEELGVFHCDDQPRKEVGCFEGKSNDDDDQCEKKKGKAEDECRGRE